MRAWQENLYYLTDCIRTWLGYSRARLWAAKGAKISRRVVIEADCRVDRPWGVTIGERSRLEQRVWLKLVSDTARIQIGKFCYLGNGTEVDVSDNVIIGNHTVIAPGCFITDHDHGIRRERRIDEQQCVAGPVRIGSDVWIGAGVCILRGVTIGDGAVVGAGAVVNQDVSDHDVVAGIPAKIIGNRSPRLANDPQSG